MVTTDLVGVKPKVLEILGENPSLPYSIIAEEVGVTRERVRQIARRNGYPSRKGVTKWRICPVCGNIYHTRRVHCSRICAYQAKRKRIIVSCYTCGKPIERAPGALRNKSGNYFCSRVCFYKKWNKEKSSTISLK